MHGTGLGPVSPGNCTGHSNQQIIGMTQISITRWYDGGKEEVAFR